MRRDCSEVEGRRRLEIALEEYTAGELADKPSKNESQATR
jgi:hypothetical protein